ncbi:prolactin-releasing peptide receptor-like [Hypanus sabinus]|uniref:prolactin-releasing peptide receptor-like n=1 Tax=Hypanus sabinus TaxID=79690 RepID=UPI0028C3B137|nr:prolactin-releasing peptide receptor-like [Hypanus sabinus]XP_059806913.1 prolactin-releasing peptide receptor-like [Hypanus sabinus]
MNRETMGEESAANGSWPVTFPGTDLLQRYKPFFILLYGALVAVACVGNAFLIGCIAADKKLHNATNFFIGNLSAADLLMCLCCVPLTLSYAFEPRGWLFGGFMCHLTSLLQSATVYVSVLSLTAIAVDRYMLVAHPVRRRIGLGACGTAVAGIWLLSLALAAPAAAHVRYLELPAIGFSACGESWPASESQKIAYSCTVLLVSYMLPLSAVIASYCAITVHLKRRDTLEESGRNPVHWGKRKRRTFLPLVVSVLVFGIIDLDTKLTILNYHHIKVLHLSCHWLVMSSSCYNPFICASLHSKFQLCLRGYVQRRKRKDGLVSNVLSPAAPTSS